MKRELTFEEKDMEMLWAVKRLIGKIPLREMVEEYGLSDKEAEFCGIFYSICSVGMIE